MADFSLGTARVRNRQRQSADKVNEVIPPERFFQYSRGFELWHHQQQIHQRQQQQPLYSASSGALLGFGGADETRSSTRGSGGGMSCQDCGNQAKKDCAHLRCRTCCKSRGFQCPTHVKSTWVSADKRRERRQQLASAAVAQPPPQSSPVCRHVSAPAGETQKKLTDFSTRLPTTTSGVTEGVLGFPVELSSSAVFRCVMVTPIEEADDQFAYQTAVSIGGHVFKGILYDQGPEASPSTQYQLQHRGDSSSTAVVVADIENTVMGTTAGSLTDPSSLYTTPLSAFMAGTQFFSHHHPRY